MNQQKKTLYLSPNGYLGGAEKAMLQFCIAHQAHHWPFIILFLNDGEAYQLAVKAGLPVILLPQHLRFKLRSIKKLWRAIRFIREIIRKEDIKIIHATMAYGHIVAALSSLFFPTKRYWFQHGPVGGALDNIASCFPVNAILFNSAFLQREHNKLNYLASPLDREYIVPLAIAKKSVDLKKVAAIKQQFISPLILIAGRICSWKGYDTAIKALSSIKTPWHLLIIGSPQQDHDRQYLAFLKQLVDKLQLTTKVTFLDFTSDIHHYFHAADLFLHTSNTPEPFGLVVAEAMLQKTFVIGSDHGGVNDILINNLTGLTFSATSKERVVDLRRQINTFFTLDSTTKERLIQQAYNLIITRHDPSRATKYLEWLYQEL